MKTQRRIKKKCAYCSKSNVTYEKTDNYGNRSRHIRSFCMSKPRWSRGLQRYLQNIQQKSSKILQKTLRVTHFLRPLMISKKVIRSKLRSTNPYPALHESRLSALSKKMISMTNLLIPNSLSTVAHATLPAQFYTSTKASRGSCCVRLLSLVTVQSKVVMEWSR